MDVNDVISPRLFIPKHQQQQQPPASIPEGVAYVIISVLQSRVIDILPVLGFIFLTYNVVEALYKAKGDYGTISFVVFSYANLIVLFYCLKSFENLPQGKSSRRTKLKIAIWTLATSLNFSFSYRVTSILDSAVMSSFVWILAVATTVGAFYGLFVLPDD